ncbi:MAG: hypothetical protein J6Z34_07355, partial [Clostridia bacterium]|nr:hypothetical protein [Clostridia bacterium]
MIKLETHCHSLGGSHCATSPNEILVEDYVLAGYGGVVITNHLSVYSYAYHKGETHAEKTRFYFSLVENLRKQFMPFGVKVFSGVEVRIPDSADQGAQEYMIYGVTEKDIMDNKPLFYYSQEELFRFADKKGYFMYQVHPFRDGIKCGDPRFLHGAEKFNGHFHHYNHNDLAEEFCRKNNLIGMSGTEYHHEHQPITSGMYIPETV